MTRETFKTLGFQDTIHDCDRCGKTGLKGTWTIETESGEVFNLGSTCIKKGWQMTQKEFTAKVKQDEIDRVKKAQDEWRQTPERRAEKEFVESGEHQRIVHELGPIAAIKAFDPWRKVRQTIADKHGVSLHRVF